MWGDAPNPHFCHEFYITNTLLITLMGEACTFLQNAPKYLKFWILRWYKFGIIVLKYLSIYISKNFQDSRGGEGGVWVGLLHLRPEPLKLLFWPKFHNQSRGGILHISIIFDAHVVRIIKNYNKNSSKK